MNLIVSWFHRGVILFLILQLVACTTITKSDTVGDSDLGWSERLSQLSQIEHWKINGRLAITNKSEVWHLSVKWQQQLENYKIHLSGPFGAGAVQLKGDQAGVIIKTEDDTVFSADAEQLLYETTGVQIPIQDLFYWIRGLPNPESEISDQVIDSHGRLKQISQNNWNIRFKRYKKTNNTFLPSKIFIKRDSLDIRFVIEDWSILS